MRGMMTPRRGGDVAPATTSHGRVRRTLWCLVMPLAVLLCLAALTASGPIRAHAQTSVVTHSAAISEIAATTAKAVGDQDVVPAGAPRVGGTAAILLDPATEHVYLSMHADQRLAMASTTKIMTTVVALTYGKPDQKITVGADSAAMNNAENSSAGLKEGDVLTLRELLYGLLLPSGDDASVAIADGVAGSQANFVTLMNAEAALLGLTHTHYVNPHGLDAQGHYTTASDLARLARFALSFKLFSQIVATPSFELAATSEHPPFTWANTNTLLVTRYPGVIGIKTGHTGDAGYCLVFAAQRSYGKLLGVVLGDAQDAERFSDARALLDWGFAQQKREDAWKTAIFGA
jgi:D-alanyl-D-alanine carboxypeptidase (penicillin-binding protein 5/6)